MNGLSKRNKLILLLVAEIIVIIIHNILKEPPSSIENWLNETGWHYFLGLGLGVWLFAYALSLNCRKCGAGQVIRSMNILSLRLPQEYCWKCGEIFDKESL